MLSNRLRLSQRICCSRSGTSSSNSSTAFAQFLGMPRHVPVAAQPPFLNPRVQPLTYCSTSPAIVCDSQCPNIIKVRGNPAHRNRTYRRRSPVERYAVGGAVGRVAGPRLRGLADDGRARARRRFDDPAPSFEGSLEAPGPGGRPPRPLRAEVGGPDVEIEGLRALGPGGAISARLSPTTSALALGSS